MSLLKIKPKVTAFLALSLLAVVIALTAFFVMQKSSTAMILHYDTSLSSGKSISLPFVGKVDVVIDWGDESQQSVTTTSTEVEHINHTYKREGTYKVTINGQLEHFGYKDYFDFEDFDFGNHIKKSDKLVRVESFGEIDLTNLSQAFAGAKNLTRVPSSLPATVTTLEGMFYQAYAFNQSLNSWDTSNITNMSLMFYQATSFNQSLNQWNTSQVTDMRHMFLGASSFNQTIGDWDVRNVTQMNEMFASTPFNQDISRWDTSNVTSMAYMFDGAYAFDQDISNWNINKVTSMKGMFRGARAFKRSTIDSWNIEDKEALF